MIKIIRFCYVCIAQPEPNPPQIFCDPEAVHLIADVKNSLKMCCMLSFGSMLRLIRNIRRGLLRVLDKRWRETSRAHNEPTWRSS